MNAILRTYRFLQTSGGKRPSGGKGFNTFMYLIVSSNLQPRVWRKHLEETISQLFCRKLSPEWIPSPYGREGYLWVATLPVAEFPPVFHPTTPDTTRRTYA